MNRILGMSVAGALAAIAGCSTAPIQNSRLEGAEQAVRAASSNPDVTSRAPLELDKARKALDLAESSWQQGADAAVINHQAYIAEQRAHIAIESAAQRKAEAEIAKADAERNAVLLQARERQAHEAQAQAEARLHQAQQAESQARQAQDAARRAQQLAAEHERAAAQRQAQLVQARQRADALASQVNDLQSQMQDMKAQQTERGWVLTLGADVLFDTGQSTLKPGSRRTLRQLASFLAEHPGQAVEVDGYADSTGGEAANEALSQRRAQAVKDALAGLGIDSSRITVQGLGESYPVASNDTAAGRQLNRRVEIVLPRNQSTARAESPASQGSSSQPH